MTQFNFKAIGTSWQIDFDEELENAKGAQIISDIKNRIELFESNYSRFRENSIVTQISKEESKNKIYTLPEDAEKMLSFYYDLYLKTDGFFTPLIGQVLSDAGYDANYSLETKEHLSSPPEWDEALEYNHPNLLIKKPALLDFGACGKGYIIDIIGDLLEKNNIYDYCIDAGSDILHKNKTPIRVGLENPENIEQVIGVCTLGNESLCGSAGNRRVWKNFNHIINPKTLKSPTDIIAVWVMAEGAMLADAMTTCLFFVPAKTLLDAYEFEYVILKKDFSIEKSDGFLAEFFS